MNGHFSDQRHEGLKDRPTRSCFLQSACGHFSYAIPWDTRDRYTLILHFVELYFVVKMALALGSRVFRVIATEDLLLDNFDIYKGRKPACAHQDLYHVKPTAQRKAEYHL